MPTPSPHSHARLGIALGLALSLAALLAACGGAGTPVADTPSGVANTPTKEQASRFLTQASFGPTAESVDQLSTGGYAQWFDQQTAAAQPLLEPVMQGLYKGTTSGVTDARGFQTVWWPKVTGSSDQLRERLQFALSELFVISFADDNTGSNGIAVANYYDMLGRNAFGTYRTLLEDVTLHPLMGIYLSWVNNKKETLDSTGNIVRTPDENYAREVMQLFTIGLVQLNADGSPKLDSAGQPIPTYTHDDIYGLARVLTGWSTDPAAAATGTTDKASAAFERGVPMIPRYPNNHSTSAKTFLGVTIAANPRPTADSMRAELKTALDTLADHPNVGPFVGRQLIQRLVTSNPSPAYVQRVSAVWADNGQGVRGDLKAVVRAVLMDADAHSATTAADPAFGKLREPLLRLSHWMRAFKATGTTPQALMPPNGTGSPATSLGMQAMVSPSVFNFYRPGYVPANSAVGSAGLTAPEMQITDAQSVIGYQNLMKTVVEKQYTNVTADYSAELALTEDADIDKLLDRLNLVLMQGRMDPDLRTDVRAAVLSIPLQNAKGTTKGDTERKRRVWTAVFLLMASPEYIVQK